jgi:hypothetical protein
MTQVACQDASVRRETPMTRAASSGRKYKRGSGADVSLLSPIVVSPFMQLCARLLVCVRGYGFLLDHGSEITTPEIEIPESADVEHCPEYPSASAFSYACEKFSIFYWTCFCMSPGSVAGSELPAREVLCARPLAEC